MQSTVKMRHEQMQRGIDYSSEQKHFEGRQSRVRRSILTNEFDKSLNDREETGLPPVRDASVKRLG